MRTSPSPGRSKDREILATQPYLVLEGMLLGLLAVGAEEGWVFIRHEYGPEERVIRAEIEWLRAAGLIGPTAPEMGAGGRRLSVEVFTSPGDILGEKSALMERMEGHAGASRATSRASGTRRTASRARRTGRDVRPRDRHRPPRRGLVEVGRARPAGTAPSTPD